MTRTRASAADDTPTWTPPRLGEVGSWTRLPEGGVGQVWALSPGRVTVWVADGQRYIALPVSDLAAPGDDRDDVALFDIEAT